MGKPGTRLSKAQTVLVDKINNIMFKFSSETLIQMIMLLKDGHLQMEVSMMFLAFWYLFIL